MWYMPQLPKNDPLCMKKGARVARRLRDHDIESVEDLYDRLVEECPKAYEKAAVTSPFNTAAIIQKKEWEPFLTDLDLCRDGQRDAQLMKVLDKLLLSGPPEDEPLHLESVDQKRLRELTKSTRDVVEALEDFRSSAVDLSLWRKLGFEGQEDGEHTSDDDDDDDESDEEESDIGDAPSSGEE